MTESPGMEFDELENSMGFDSLDMKLAASLSKVLNGDLQHRVNIMKETRAKQGRLVKGRQILYLINQHFRVSVEEGCLYDLRDLLAVKLRNGDLKKFVHNWEQVCRE